MELRLLLIEGNFVFILLKIVNFILAMLNDMEEEALGEEAAGKLKLEQQKDQTKAGGGKCC